MLHFVDLHFIILLCIYQLKPLEALPVSILKISMNYQ